MVSRVSPPSWALALMGLAGCGRVSVDLLDVDAGARDGGSVSDAGSEPGPGDAATPDTGVGRDDAGVLDAGAGSDGGSEDGAVDGSWADAAGGDAALADAATDGGGAIDAGAVDAGPAPCNFAGVWAARLDMTVSWPNSIGVASGSGPAPVWFRLNFSQAGTTLTGTVLLCGIAIPDFDSSVGSDVYGLDFIMSTLDRVPPVLPTSPLTLTLAGLTPGSAVTAGPTAVMSGASLANPLTDAWPSATALTSVDSDADGNPGITANYKGAPRTYPAINAALTRAQSAYLGSRIVFTLSGSAPSCAEMAGPATVNRYDTHILGCRVQGDSRNCTVGAAPLESGTLDSARPVYTPSNASYVARKLAANATCADVRAAFP